jgi:hypothetical protein
VGIVSEEGVMKKGQYVGVENKGFESAEDVDDFKKLLRKESEDKSAAEFAEILYAGSQLKMSGDDIQRCIAHIYNADGSEWVAPEVKIMRDRLAAQIERNRKSGKVS